MSDNVRRAIRFERPERIPVNFVINDACWTNYPPDWLAEQIERHPLVFHGRKAPALPYTPDYALVARRDAPYTDDFGCVWVTAENGITGTVKGHPLAEIGRLKDYRFPDPAVCMGIGPVDWEAEKRRLRAAREAGDFVFAGLRHGHTFLQLSDMLGYEQLLFAMEDEEPWLGPLIDGVEEFNRGILERYLAIGVDLFAFPEDLGMQRGPMLSPENFRRWIKPSYTRLMRRAREAGTAIHMHSDGDIRALAADLVGSGVEVLNLQDLVNGIEWIRENYRGKLCVELDVDRQSVTRFGSPALVRELIRTEIDRLSTPEGGLMFVYGLYPGIPRENAEALLDALENETQLV